MRRIFLAFQLPEGMRSGLQNYFDKSLPFRWTSPENLHVTLNFLGSISDYDLRNIFDLTKTVCLSNCPQAIYFEKLLPVGSMIWAQIKNTESLQALYFDLRDAFQEKGIGEPQRSKFRPHVNLARSKSGAQNLFEEKTITDLRFEATRVTIFESKLKPSGPQYFALDSFKLNCK